MKKETEKKKKLLTKIKSNIATSILLILVITGMLLFACYFPKIAPITPYPEEKYKMLEKEAGNILVNDKYIDIEKLSDKNIECTIDYYLSDNESDSNLKIKLIKGNLSVYVTVIKSSDNTLLVEKIERSMTKSEYDEMVKDKEVIKKFINIFCIIASIFLFLAILIISLDTFYQIKEYRQFQKANNS